MLKRLRSAHPMLYCLVAEVLFLGMLFVASLLSLHKSIHGEAVRSIREDFNFSM